MRILLDTRVPAAFSLVKDNFNEGLFTYLLPPGATLLRYDGSSPGDIVHLTLPVAGEWQSQIVEEGTVDDGYYFVDTGNVLPFGLKSWRHRHELKSAGKETIIRDDMNYSTGSRFLDIVLYPFMYLAFLPRKHQYRSYFARLGD